MNIVDKAVALALKAHHGDVNKHDDSPYLLHLHAVSVLVREAGGDPAQIAIAWLHDSVEDGKISFQQIREALAGEAEVERVIAGVDGMTKRPGESNEDYYWRCKANADSCFVKLRGDIVHNFGRNHQIPDDNTRLRMAKKYSLGVDILSR